MGSVLCDLTVFQYTDAVCITYGGQSVCDHDHGFSLRKSGKSLPALLLHYPDPQMQLPHPGSESEHSFSMALAMESLCASPPDT